MRTLVLYPDLHHGCRVFDDERTGLEEEAFVRGASEMISRLVETKGIPRATSGFGMTFAAEPFPGHDADPAGVDPIWVPPPGVITRRFVEAPR